MKKNLLYILSVLLLIACSEEERTFVKTDSVAPQPVSNVEVTNIPGGAILKYTLPDDEDLLCVKANYELKSGVSSEVKASLFVDTLKIEGFGTEDERIVELVAIDRSLNESSPVKVTVKPLEAPVVTIGRTLKLIADFGGVHAYWDNPGRSEISVILEQKDNNNEFNRIDAYYSTVVEGSAATRGMDTDPKRPSHLCLRNNLIEQKSQVCLLKATNLRLGDGFSQTCLMGRKVTVTDFIQLMGQVFGRNGLHSI